MALKRDLMLVLVGRLVSALMALITMRAVTTFLTPEQYGELALLVAVQMFCGLFFINPVGQYINLHTHAWWDDGSLTARLKSYWRYTLLASFLGGLIVFSIENHYSVDRWIWAPITMFVMVAAGTWNATLIPMLNMLGFRAASVLWSIVSVVMGLTSSLIFVIWVPSAFSWFAGQAIGLLVGTLGAGYFLRRHTIETQRFQKRLALIDKHTLLTYCLPLALATGLMWLQLSGYRFVVEQYWGLAQLGFLAIGLQLAGQIFSLSESLAMQFIYPFFYRRVSKPEDLEEVELAFSDLLSTLMPIYFVLAGMVIFGAPYLLAVLVSSQFQDAINFVMLGAGIELCRVLGNLFSNAAHVKRQTNSLIVPYAVGSVTALSLIWFFGVRQEEVGWAGFSLLAGSSAMLVAMLIKMYWQVRFSIDIWRCFVGGGVMILAAFSICLPTVYSLGEAVGMLLLIFVVASAVVLALLWKNPSMLRLLNAQLRNQ